MGKVKDLDTKEGRESLFLNGAADQNELDQLLEETRKETEKLLAETENLYRILDELTGMNLSSVPKEKKGGSRKDPKERDFDLMF